MEPALGQVRDCIGLSGESRFRIWALRSMGSRENRLVRFRVCRFIDIRDRKRRDLFDLVAIVETDPKQIA
jgi:hypothetical protein